jgi:hypothetical protein
LLPFESASAGPDIQSFAGFSTIANCGASKLLRIVIFGRLGMPAINLKHFDPASTPDPVKWLAIAVAYKPERIDAMVFSQILGNLLSAPLR